MKMEIWQFDSVARFDAIKSSQWKRWLRLSPDLSEPCFWHIFRFDLNGSMTGIMQNLNTLAGAPEQSSITRGTAEDGLKPLLGSYPDVSVAQQLDISSNSCNNHWLLFSCRVHSMLRLLLLWRRWRIQAVLRMKGGLRCRELDWRDWVRFNVWNRDGGAVLVARTSRLLDDCFALLLPLYPCPLLCCCIP